MSLHSEYEKLTKEVLEIMLRRPEAPPQQQLMGLNIVEATDLLSDWHENHKKWASEFDAKIVEMKLLMFNGATLCSKFCFILL